MIDETTEDKFYGTYTCVREGCGREFRVEKHLHDGTEKYGPHPRFQFCTVCRNEGMLGLRDLQGWGGRTPGDEIPEDERHYPVGPGWVKLMLGLHEAIMEIAPDYQIAQIKEKFGGLRYYVDAVPKAVHAMIDAAEHASYHTCEECGAEGQARGGGWIKTLCDEHAGDREPLPPF